MGMINFDLAAVGCFRAYLIHKPPEKTRVYEPDVQPNPLNSDGTLNEEKYSDNINVYPEALWVSKALQDAVTETVQPCWCINEIGDNKHPIIIGFMGKGIPAGNQWVGHTYGVGTGGSGGTSDGNGGVDSGATISGVTKNIVFTGHGSNEPISELILHSIAGPSEDTNAIINTLKNKDLGIHSIISNTGVTQCAEWNTVQYHCPGHNSHSIGCEMLESRHLTWNQSTWIPSWSSSNDAAVKSYHEGVYANAVNLYAQLAVKFGLDVSAIKSHKEAAGNHGDPESLWDQFKAKWGDNKWTMDGFRANVKIKMEEVKKQMSSSSGDWITKWTCTIYGHTSGDDNGICGWNGINYHNIKGCHVAIPMNCITGSDSNFPEFSGKYGTVLEVKNPKNNKTVKAVVADCGNFGPNGKYNHTTALDLPPNTQNALDIHDNQSIHYRVVGHIDSWDGSQL